MRFTRIAFHQYRCFLGGEIDFTLPKGTPKERNVILFSAENGGGKTQLLFAFRFALFGLSESDFEGMQGQGATPYALNKNKYEKLANGTNGKTDEAWVELAFEYAEKTYTIRRRHLFRRTVAGVTTAEHVELRVQGRTGDVEAVFDSPEEVRLQMSRIIPEKTLYALLCDGEYVTKLSSAGTETNGAVRAIVQRMTEHALLDQASIGLEKVLKQIRRAINRSSVGSESLVEEGAIEREEENRDRLSEQIESGTRQIEDAKFRMRQISEDLRQIASVREKEQSRQDLYRSIESLESDLEEAERKFVESLNEQSYWGMADKLTNDVQTLLKDCSLRFPGLQAEVVGSVLKGDKCICGRDIDERVRAILEELRLHLPPINVDAELSSVLHQYGQEQFRRNRRKEICERIDTMNRLVSRIDEAKTRIKAISAEIDASRNPNALKLEGEHRSCVETLTKYSQLVARWRIEQKESQDRLARYLQLLEEMASRDRRGHVLQRKLNLVQGALTGVRLLKEHKLAEALKRINVHLQKAFEKLRSRADTQRQVYITMYQDVIRIVSYLEEPAEREATRNVSQEMSEEDRLRVREEAILANAESNSMGQLKMTSLAFMKAVLDYVKEVAGRERHLADAEYPIVVDAPFSNIMRENYDNAVNCIHEFSDQVILLLADKDVPKGVAPYVAKTYSVRRVCDGDNASNYSKISLMK